VGEGTLGPVSDTVREIEQARERLEDDLEELAGRLPRIQEAAAGAVLKGKKVLLPTLGAASGGLVIWAVDRRLRTRRARKIEEAAEEILPEDWMEALRDGRWRGPAVLAASLWVVVRLAEARAMKRLSKALVLANARAALPEKAGKKGP